MKKILFFIFSMIFAFVARSQTTISDGQKVTGKWTKAKSPYIINGEAIIPAGTTLTIEPGVEVKLKTGTKNTYTMRKEFDLGFLRVNGTLIAEGTTSEKILFTADGSGNWGIILFTATSVNSSLKYCKIEKAGGIINAEEMKSFYGSISFYMSKGEVNYCEISDNSSGAIHCVNSASPKITNCMIISNLNAGIYCNASAPVIENCTITKNGWEGISCISSSKPTLKNSIIWDNGKNNNFGAGTISYCLIEESALSAEAKNGGNNIFSQDPMFNNIAKEDFSLKAESPCVNKSSSSTNLGSDLKFTKASETAVIKPTVVEDPNAYLKYYATEIETELNASGLFAPKGEFEKSEDYKLRVQKAEEFKKTVLEKYKLKYEKLKVSVVNTEDNELQEKIKNSYKEFTITFMDLGVYNADDESFFVTLKFAAPTTKEEYMPSQTIKIPIAEAQSFKINYRKAKITACEQLLEDGKIYEIFNIKITHPVTATVYPFGLQKEPLYIEKDDSEELFVDDSELDGIPNLKAEIKFVEPSANNLLDAEETAYLQLTITNSGTGSALDIDIAVTCSNEFGFTFDKNINIPKIKAGEKLNSNIEIRADKTLANDSRIFNIKFTEQRGFPPAPIKITIGTQEIKTPKLYFVETGITEESGNKNNIIENGELIFASILIQNKGQGKAEKVNANIIIGDKNIVAVKTTDFPLIREIGDMAPGEAKKINFYFSVNWVYDGPEELPIEIQLSESKKLYGGSFSLSLSTKTQSIATNDVKVEGVYGDDVEIKDASLSVDVDINIPNLSKPNKYKYALIIGNENYSKFQKGLTATSDVEFAIHDAQVFKEYAIKTMGVPEANIIELYDGQRFEMERDIAAFTRLSELSDGKAELIVFYAGHGFPDSKTNDAYIMPVDISGADVTNGIKLADFYQQLSASPTKKITVFIDACFSGGGRNEGLIPARSGVRIKPNATTINGKIVSFSASSGEQISLPYRDKKHGMFTYFLLKAMQENKGNISYGDLFDYIKSNVQTHSITINKQEQNPKLNTSGDVESEWENWKINE